MTLTEQDIRNALFGKARRKAKPAARPDSLLVIMTVRESWGGLPYRMELRVASISRLEAFVEASKRARALGLKLQAIVDIQALEK